MQIHQIIQRIRERFLPAAHRKNIGAARRALPRLQQLARQSPGQCFAYLRRLDPLVFEELILECYYQLGHRIRRGTRYSGDGGIDGWVKYPVGNPPKSVWTPIQCKRYASAINPQHVADFQSVLAVKRKVFGLFVHTGRTGDLSKTHAKTEVRFVSGDRLLKLIKGESQ